MEEEGEIKGLVQNQMVLQLADGLDTRGVRRGRALAGSSRAARSRLGATAALVRRHGFWHKITILAKRGEHGHGLSNHPRRVRDVRGQHDTVAGLGQLAERLHILLGNAQRGGIAPPRRRNCLRDGQEPDRRGLGLQLDPLSIGLGLHDNRLLGSIRLVDLGLAVSLRLEDLSTLAALRFSLHIHRLPHAWRWRNIANLVPQALNAPGERGVVDRVHNAIIEVLALLEGLV
mmetsp:Transcript_24000/g.76590  ORF Transcript_24000/g.76590 Transcript_24000/m.76590 type:complete len:231 (+) Transcript_24000:215-907(+)